MPEDLLYMLIALILNKELRVLSSSSNDLVKLFQESDLCTSELRCNTLELVFRGGLVTIVFN